MNALIETGDLGQKLDEAISNKHLLKHRFYVRWQEGQVTQHELQGYAREYYQFEREFPRFVSTLHAQCEDPKMRQELLEHLIDEERGEDNHPELWLRFAEGLGVPRSSVEEHFHSDETENLLRVIRRFTKRSLIEGLASLYAYEKQQPEVVEKKIEGLKAYYGLQDDNAVEFFRVHREADVWHADSALQMLKHLCRSDEQKRKAANAVFETTEALYDFLDGVERRYH